MDTLKAEKRSMDVTAKRLRREGYVTGCIFGREIENSIPVKIEKRELERLLKTSSKGSQIMLNLDGQDYDVLIKTLEYNALAGRYDEIDFQALVSNQKVHSVAEIVLLNREAVIGGVAEQILNEISYKALPADLTDKVEIDLAGMRAGETIRVHDLAIAKNPNVDVKTDLDADVVTILAVHVEEAAEDTADADQDGKGKKETKK